MTSIRLLGEDTPRMLREESGERGMLPNNLLLFSLIWPILLLPKELQFFLLLLVALFALKKHKIYFDLLSFFLVSYVVVYAFSVFVNMWFFSSEWIRLVAAFNSLGSWVVAVLFYLLFKNSHVNMRKFIRMGFINYLVLLTLWAVSMLVFSLTGLADVSILGRTLYYSETFNQEVVARFVGLMEYSNLIVMFCLFFYPLYFLHIRRQSSKWVQIVLLTLGVLPLVSSYSRSGYLVFGAAITVAAVYYGYHSVSRDVFFFAAFFALAVVLVVFYTSDLHERIQLQVEELATAREGSNDSREIIVTESIDRTQKDSPIVGMGVKDTSSIGYPLGSHSTFLGFFYKTGTIGLLLGTAIFVLINAKILLLKPHRDRTLMGIFIFVMPFVFIVEDMDGANWLICLYFAWVAVLFNDRNWKTSND